MDLKETGRVLWWYTHTLAKSASTMDKYMQFVQHIHFLSDHYPCALCRTHLIEYVSKNPIYFAANGDNNGLLGWSVGCHNQVNLRLGKPLMDLATASQLYK